MKLLPTNLKDVSLLEPAVFEDDRGFFIESWNQKRLAELGIDAEFVQDNHSRSARHVLRGLHYQLLQEQGKLVRVVSGAVFDVAVDIRRSSPTFGQWTGHVLSEANKRMMWIPPGFAHGFLSLVDNTDFLYKCTQPWAPSLERVIAWDDPSIDIPWPLAGEHPIVSSKDAHAPHLSDQEAFA